MVLPARPETQAALLVSEPHRGVFLRIPNFRDEPAAGPQVVWTVVQQAGVKIETARSAVQGGARLPGSDLGLKRVEHPRVDIRGIGHEQVKERGARHGSEQVAAAKREAVADLVRVGILLGNGQDCLRSIDRPDLRARQCGCEGNGNAAAARPNIEDARGGEPRRCQQAESRLNDDLRIGPRNEHAGADLECERPEFLVAGDVGNRLAACTAGQELLEVIFLRSGNSILEPTVQARPAYLQRMSQNDFRVQAGGVNIVRPECAFGPGHKLGNRINAERLETRGRWCMESTRVLHRVANP